MMKLTWYDPAPWASPVRELSQNYCIIDGAKLIEMNNISIGFYAGHPLTGSDAISEPTTPTSERMK